MTFTKIIHNVLTGKITESNLTDEEYKAVKANEEHGKKIAEEEQLKTAAQEALILKLNITSDEAKLLFGGN